jgi:tetratricopeptide (TPR) repeat protein
LRYFSDPEGHQRVAGQLAQVALQLDSSLAEAHAVLGDLAFRQSWNLARGESELRRAVELEPHKSEYHAWLAGLLADEGRFDEAYHEIDLAVAEDPLWPAVYSMAAFVAGAARDNERMLAAAHKYEALAPESSWCHNQLAWAYFSAGRYPEALAEWRKMAVIDGDTKRIALEDRGLAAFKHGGIVAYGNTRIEAIKTHSVDLARHANDFSLAEWYAFVGNHDQAMDALNELIAERDGVVVALAVDPMFDNLHTDAHFLGVLREVGLTLPDFAPKTKANR